jgi:hypothetical protein
MFSNSWVGHRYTSAYSVTKKTRRRAEEKKCQLQSFSSFRRLKAMKVRGIRTGRRTINQGLLLFFQN